MLKLISIVGFLATYAQSQSIFGVFQKSIISAKQLDNSTSTCKFEELDELVKFYKEGESFSCIDEGNSTKRWTCTVYTNDYTCILHVSNLPRNVTPPFELTGTLIANYTDLKYIKSLFPTAKKGILLYRASSDGWGMRDFHNSCDNYGNTLTIIRGDNGRKFGGFNAFAW